MDRGACRATVHGVACKESDTTEQLSLSGNRANFEPIWFKKKMVLLKEVRFYNTMQFYYVQYDLETFNFLFEVEFHNNGIQ